MKHGGGTGQALSAGIFCCRVSPFFCLSSAISRFGERFRDGQYSLVSFSFAVLILTVPPCPMESAPVIFPTVRNSPSPGLHRLTIFLAAIFYILSFHFP